MPAKGKHRRPKSQRFSRSIAVAGTGGAALALPLMGAAGAHAMTPTAAISSTPEKTATISAATVSQKSATVSEKTATTSTAPVKTYSVKVGDWLARIAERQHLSGGWQKLYSDNRQAIGSDPSLIHPGLKLTIGERAVSTDDAKPSTESFTQSSAKTSTRSAARSATGSSGAADAPKSQAAAPRATGAATNTGYTLPVEGATIGTGYKVAGSMWSSGYHTGVDFVVPTGTTVKAVAAGTVVSAGWGGAYGNQVVIQHADGRYSQYAHLSALSVSAGQTVTESQQIGLSGATGNVTGPHLHFEIRTTPNYGSDVDPVAYLRAHGVAVG
ncbi:MULTISPECIES: M23 family metallopeptidase [unclassified Streptomyces]|uniref:M23 family metallopeptidase n=1 Tax=unclassified Streptomyces TaxID=2593676 RepID=UPI001163DD40|nr:MULTISPECIES: M23 family metallopeptidase [unclassified Streptomyces]NMI62537.1 peptidoglycan DD-metalloendopeptidase family protein [Streptomyces sp. RLA2-12]QDN61531.1 M23 family metallopeptidase [Streptomyces sp. S1D4-20]QDN71584.1 M23 family metallopeptidase [Streptomyces sp. S1D4-14]QDO54040.1 M23 family metallopeptidase [Streptomyces sp. RLB3-5]QDO64285.1 M23 family metallopeptidase [Streptomyces sp. RLB1-8]